MEWFRAQNISPSQITASNLANIKAPYPTEFLELDYVPFKTTEETLHANLYPFDFAFLSATQAAWESAQTRRPDLSKLTSYNP